MKKSIMLFCTFVSLLLGIQMNAQNTKANLAKYWLYRERLRKYFVVVDADDRSGTNIPFSYVKDSSALTSHDYTKISTGDGNDELQYYIGMLATEYALFKRYGMTDAKEQTRKELLYALKAVERLDRDAEGNWDPNFSKDLNGFFIRDDIKSDFADTWENVDGHQSFKNITNIGSCFVEGRNGYPYEESKDNVWNFIPNLALVDALVDDPEILVKNKQITYRMITYMHHFNDWITIPDWVPYFGGDDIGIKTWLILNPATQSELTEPKGGKIEEIGINVFNQEGFNYGFAEAAKNISGLPFTHYGASENCKNEFLKNFNNTDKATTLFEKLIHGLNDLLTSNFNVSTYFATRNSWLSLATVSAQNSDLQTAVSNTNATVMDRLLKQLKRDDESYYEHLPLIRSLLVQNCPYLQTNNLDDITTFISSLTWSKPFYEHLLNIAPVCGPVNVIKDEFDIYHKEIHEWGTANRLTMSDKLVTIKQQGLLEINNSDWFGYYNGIDYLMLHNLYWLTMLPFYETLTLKQNDYIAFKILYPGYYNSRFYRDESAKFITSERTIPSGFEINYTAAEGIDLIPGFTAETSSCFDATINADWKYEKIDYSVLPNSNTCFDAIPFSIPNTTIAVPALASAISNSEVTSSLKSDIEPSNGLNSVEIKQSISMEPIAEKVQLHVAPNPNSGNFTVKLVNNKGQYSVKIYSVTGVEISSFSGIDDNFLSINITTSGIYFIKIDNGTEIFHQRIVCK